MGQEIGAERFAAADFARFAGRLRRETDLLGQAARQRRLCAHGYAAGFELEAWLIDRNFFPVPNNESYLARLAHPLVVPELSKFNVELNGTPLPLRGGVLSRLERELEDTWRRCLEVAHEEQTTLICIGTLPTLRERDLSLKNMSPLNRYRALNEQVLKARGGRPLRLDVRGRERLRLTHDDVMLEAATTSFQVHLQVPYEEAVRCYNASLILSAPMVAVAANSPFLFDTALWDETRIPVFEQAVDVGEEVSPERKRVTFGSGYLRDSAVEFFEENVARFPVLLPIAFDAEEGAFAHLRLHNGTIWRWNRLLIGVEPGAVPHVRIEHRVMPAGPTIEDMIANAALYYGAVRFLASRRRPPEEDMPFAVARDNFYAAARGGLAARVTWCDGREVPVRQLVLDELLPSAAEGLGLFEVDEEDIERYLDLIAARVRTAQNGAVWQLAHARKWGRDFFRLTANYLEHQRTGVPVHEWDI